MLKTNKYYLNLVTLNENEIILYTFFIFANYYNFYNFNIYNLFFFYI